MKRYIKTADEIQFTSAMQKLIQDVVDEWRKDIKEQDCESFKEFCQVNDYEASDIRDEIRYMVDHMFGGYMYDDGTVIGASDDSEISYRQFKKAVTDQLKEV